MKILFPICKHLVQIGLPNRLLDLTQEKTEEILAIPDLIIDLATQVKQLNTERNKLKHGKAWIGKNIVGAPA